jgi:anthranilate phosphoribosyltransferase
MSQEFSWASTLGTLEKGQDLSTGQAHWAMREILENRADTEQIKAFLLALRVKGESVHELSAFIDEMFLHSSRISIEERGVDVVGTGGDLANTINISTTAAIVAAAAGARVVKHGSRAATSLSGSADLLEALGVAISLNGPAIETSVRELGIGFCLAPVFHPAMRFAAPARTELGVPTVFNILGPLANPAKPQAIALGVANEKMHELMAQVLADRGVDGFVFRGDDGLDEITLTTSTTLITIGSGKIVKSTIDPKDFGIGYSPLSAIKGGDAQENARITTAVLAGEHGAYRDAVVLNAAAAIAAFRGEQERAPIERIADGVRAAIEAIDSGAATHLLERWIELSQKLAAS